MSVLPVALRASLSEISPFYLANLADCGSPDSLTSPGSVFLSSVLLSVLDAVDYVEDADDLSDLSDSIDAHEIADGAVPVYTHDRWSTFVDVSAYLEDVSEYGDVNGEDLTSSVAGTALFMIAERLVGALLSNVSEEFNGAVDTATRSAEALGDDHGHNVATWFEVPDTDTARAVLAGIEDGDPAVMDSLPSADLSGQWADGMTVARLLEEVGLDNVPDTSQAAADVTVAYEDAFSTAAEREIVRVCRAMLDQN